MKKTRVVSLLLASSIALSLLTGCTQTQKVEKEPTEITTVAEQTVPEPKRYEPYDHFFFVRYNIVSGNNHYAEQISGGQIERPDGYEILDIENWNMTKYKSSQTGGFDVWFVNYMPVEVEPVYNEATGTYDYSQPGKVIDLEEELVEEEENSFHY